MLERDKWRGYQGGQKPGGCALYRKVKGAVLVEPDVEVAMGSLEWLEGKL